MADQFITNTSGVFDIGQSVVALVTHLDEEKQRFLVSLKVSELSLLEQGAHARLIQGLKERKSIFEMVSGRGTSVGSDEQQTIGCLTSAFRSLDYILVYILYSSYPTLCLSPGESEVLQQLSAVSLGDKIKVTVGDAREDGSVTVSSDRLSEATVFASKFHTEGEDRLSFK